ncbi:MAG: SDR family oxidoreductase [Deltaproteobacteria bacterium]|nr:SDR family oxidoreductase [Deltaproteobacteria bacterium]
MTAHWQRGQHAVTRDACSTHRRRYAEHEHRGLRIVITGAGAGLGRALALALGRRGARVALVARTAGALEAVAAEVAAAGGEGHGIAGDVGDKEAIHRIAGQAMAALGGVDVLVTTPARWPVPLRPLADTDCEALERALSVNVLGPFRLTRALLGPMRLARRGLVLMVSSDAAVEAYPTWGAYGASKAALDHLARIWSAELDGHGVRVMTVDPGEMDTAMHADAMPDADRASLASPSDVAERFVEIIRHAGSIPPGQRVAAQGFSAGEPS